MSDRLARLVEIAAHDPWRLVEVAAASVARNVAAEAWFYGAMLGALALGVATDLIRRRSLRERYWTAGLRTDLVYGLIELGHVVQLLVIIPVSAFLTWAFRTYLPWATVDFSHRLPGWAQLILLFVVSDIVAYGGTGSSTRANGSGNSTRPTIRSASSTSSPPSASRSSTASSRCSC